MRILVLCVGNICRSPTAKVLLEQACEARSVVVASAGLDAMVGHPADPVAQQIAQEKGLDLSAHRAQQVSAVLCRQHDLILVMEQSHKTELLRRYPEARGKVYLMRADNNTDVEDPYRKGQEAFEIAYKAIDSGAVYWANRIAKLLQADKP
jgi:protein-tyrosine phosphatase